MQITIRKPGLMSTVQDMGRMGYLSQAVPVSGAMDGLSAQIANMAVGNPRDNAVVEFTHGGAEFTADSDILIALAGDGAYLTINHQRIPSERPIFIPKGTVIYLDHSKSGSRSYLAIAGGWDVPEVLGSRSTFITAKLGGVDGRSLKEKDQPKNTGELTLLSQAIWNSLQGETVNFPKWSIARSLFLLAQTKTIRVMPGRERDWFEDGSIADFYTQSHTLTNNSNRMGYGLAGVAMKRKNSTELFSTAVSPGTIQVTNDGSLILLMTDCQTTGGYPRIAQVAAVDLPLCAQLKPADAINFAEISHKEAEKLYIQLMLDLDKLSLAIKQKYDLI